MTEPKLISPMLDNFAMGMPISDHNGIRCCPAMAQDTEEKYIVKIVSVPASQRQLEALLLSGAYADEAAAKEYFRSLSQDIIEEAQILQKLSGIEGFVSYQKWQTVEMEDATGFEVYLLGTYKRSLERYLRRNSMTHLSAVNLGIDLCAALAACRRSGYLYVDLKPENVFITDEQEFRIGDLGFIRLTSLQFASLPDKYRSPYTPPEIADAFSSLNTTLDTYAVGLLLYQAYNNGNLPFEGDAAPAAEFPAPTYADEEMAQIILKACAVKPEDRWQDPVQMGQALVAYMQRNGANDVPIVPNADADVDAPTIAEMVDDIASSDSGAFIADANDILDEDAPEENTSDTQEAAELAQELPEEEPDPAEPVEIVLTEATADMLPEETTKAEDAEAPVEEEAEASESVEAEEEAFENLSFLDYLNEETDVSGFAETELAYDTLSQDVSDMLSQADTLATLTVPEPVVAPEPIEVPIPAPIVPEKEEPAQEEAAVQDDEDASQETVNDEEAPQEDETPDAELDETPYLPDAKPKKKKKRWVGVLIALLVLAAIGIGAFLFYENYYLQSIDALRLEGSEDTLTVYLTTDADESILTVYCSDAYGNRFAASVENGCAVFTDLDPNTFYHIEVAISGFHQIYGETGATYATPVLTEIVQLHAVTGGTDGSVILSFTVNGPDSAQWKVSYWAEDEAIREMVFTDHIVTVTGLTPGKLYSFRLTSEDDLFVTGKTEMTYTASNLIYAEDLQITGCPGNSLSAVWKAPAGVDVSSWSVRCYNDKGYNQTQTVTGTNVTFTGIDHTQAYTIEVTADGMSVSQRVYFTANTLTVSNIKADFSDPTKIIVTWDSCTPVGADGWVLLYTIDGSGTPIAVSTKQNSAVISPAVPGASYAITLQTANGSTVFGGSYTCTTPSAKVFSCTYEGFAITGSNMIFHMCKTPAQKDWDRGDLSASDYTTEFSSGATASFLVQMTRQYGISDDQIQTLFVIRDTEGKLVSTGTSTRTWTQMWYKNYCELDIPSIPTAAGEYTVTVYFNGGLAAQVDFTVI